MTEDQIGKILRNFQKVNPNQSFLARSRGQILTSSQNAPNAWQALFLRFERSSFRLAGATFGLVLVLALGIFGYFNYRSSSIAASLSKDKLLTEASSADFQIQIKEVKYYADSAEQVALALTEISNGAGSKAAAPRR